MPNLNLTLSINASDFPAIRRLVVCRFANQTCYADKAEVEKVLASSRAGLDFIVINGRRFLKEYSEAHKEAV